MQNQFHIDAKISLEKNNTSRTTALLLLLILRMKMEMALKTTHEKTNISVVKWLIAHLTDIEPHERPSISQLFASKNRRDMIALFNRPEVLAIFKRRVMSDPIQKNDPHFVDKAIEAIFDWPFIFDILESPTPFSVDNERLVITDSSRSIKDIVDAFGGIINPDHGPRHLENMVNHVFVIFAVYTISDKGEKNGVGLQLLKYCLRAITNKKPL